MPVLIVSPDPAFAELLRLTLEEHSRRSSVLAQSGQDALQRLGETRFALAILDSDTADLPLNELGSALRQAQPDLPLVIITPDPTDPEISALQPAATLSKPFYLPDLEALLDRLLEEQPAAVPASESAATPPPDEPPPPWLTDVSLAARHLTRLSLESAAQAALITRGQQLWAYAGHLPQPAAEELAQQVIALWARDGSGQTDLARFLRLRSTDREYMLYITPLVGDMVLALAFDVGTPFSQIRIQAGRLARSLAAPPESAAAPEPSPPVEKAPAADQASPAATPAAETAPPPAGDQLLLDDDWDPTAEEDLEDVPPLFEDVPPPIPADWLPTEEPTEELLNALSSPSVSSDGRAPAPVAQAQEPAGEKAPTAGQVAEPAPAASAAAEVTAQADTQPSPASVSEIRLAQPLSPSRYALHYSALLVPRLPQHHLVGDLARDLNAWIRQLCLAYGWRLESLQIRPEYLLLIVDVPPHTAPGNLMRILRRHTSAFLFSNFPRLAADNPSGEFWAPGYLITGGLNPPSPSLIRDFIRNLRRRQGIRP